MDAAAKAAQAEARTKAKTTARKEPPKADVAKPAVTAKPGAMPKPEPAKIANLFDAPIPVVATPVSAAETDEEDDILAEIEDEPLVEEDEDLAEVA